MVRSGDKQGVGPWYIKNERRNGESRKDSTWRRFRERLVGDRSLVGRKRKRESGRMERFG